MFQALWRFGMMDFTEVRAIRKAVFVTEGGIAEEAEFDWFDGIAAHLFVCDAEGAPIATGRIYPDGDATRIDRIAVLKPFRDQPYYDLTLRALLFKAEQLAGERILTRVFPEEVSCYLPFGYKQTAEITDRGRAAVELSLARDEVIWDSACKHLN